MKRILVIGASGFIGTNLVLHLREKHQVFGTYYQHLPRLDGVTWSQLNIHPQSNLQEFTRDLNPDWVIYAAATIDNRAIEHDPGMAEFVNVEAPYLLARLLAEYGEGRLIYLSTSKVFSGKEGNYAEEAEPDPVGPYGVAKWRAEERLAPYEGTYIFRLGTVYGLGSYWHQASILNRFLETLWQDQPLHLIDDEYRSFLAIDDICRAVDLALEMPQLAGTYHLAPPQRSTYYEFGKALLAAFNLTDRKITAIEGQSFAGDFAKAGGARGSDLTLSGKKFAREFSYEFLNLPAALKSYQQKLHLGKQ